MSKQLRVFVAINRYRQDYEHLAELEKKLSTASGKELQVIQNDIYYLKHYIKDYEKHLDHLVKFALVDKKAAWDKAKRMASPDNVAPYMYEGIDKELVKRIQELKHEHK